MRFLRWLIAYLALLIGIVIAWELCVSTVKGHWSSFTIVFVAIFVVVLVGMPVRKIVKRNPDGNANAKM